MTAPGTHVRFARKAIDAGKHLLIQKPMATTMADARTIADGVCKAGLKAIIEPSSTSPLDPDIAHLRDLVRKGFWATSSGLRWVQPALRRMGRR
ncbi:MAG: Gfo/Idh/MocA family oxidoreductase [Caldilineaceae bacterium]